MQKGILCCFLYTLLGVFLLSFGTDCSAQNEEPIKIGSILILSGEGSSWGIASKNGIEMAVEKINSTGGINGRKVIAVHQDDQGDPKKAISSFRYLVDAAKVQYIIGTNWSVTGLPLVDLANRGKVLMISPSLGRADFNEGSEYLFNTWPHDYILSTKLADYVYNKGHRKVALVGAEEVWVKQQTEAFRKRFEELGGKIGFCTEPLPASTDVSSDALKIKANHDIDAVVSTTDGVIIGSLMAKRLREIGVKLPIYSITLDQAAIDIAKDGFEGLEFLTFLTPTSEFKNDYELKYKTTIDIGADSAYDGVMMIAKAMRETNSINPETIATYLGKLHTYDGVSGHLISDGKRGFVKEYAVKKVVNGKPVDMPASQVDQ